MIKALNKHLNTQFPFLKQAKLLIAVSGGLDSVFLLRALYDLDYDVTVAHCNFSLRGDESNAETLFVEQLSTSLNIENHIKYFDTLAYAEKTKSSIQISARTLRYEWFQELCNSHNYDYILTAHHADDNLETLLINLSRGTGIDGLSGIPAINGNIVRPLLPFKRETIKAFAEAKHWSWKEDSSNASTKYLRNKLRHDVIPILKEINPKIIDAVNLTVNNVKDSQGFIDETVNTFLERAILSTENNNISYNVNEFLKLKHPKIYIREIFKPFGFTAFTDIEALLTAQSGKQVFSKTHSLLKNREALVLSPILDKVELSVIEIPTKTSCTEISLGQLQIQEVDTLEANTTTTVYIDKSTLKDALTVRSWVNGDYFYPYGMKGKKKLSKYFKDQKYSLIEKQNAKLLCTDSNIIWVIGQRLDSRYAANNTSKSILKISLK